MIFAMIEARSHRGTGNGTTIRAALPQDPVLANNVPNSRARDYLAEVHDSLDATWTEATDKVARFEAFRVLADETKAAWMAWIVATSFEAKEGYGATQQIPLQNRLATILEIDVASWWRPTSENFFDRVPKGALLSLLDEVGGPALTSRHASSKKPDISASCQKLFAGDAIVETEIKDKALAWVPSAMRFNDKPSNELAADDGQDELAGLIGDADGEGEDDDLGALIADGDGEPTEDDETAEADDGSVTGEVPHPDNQNDDTTDHLVAAE
jgi:ParB family transcriptional regulator, chromosome partitioning protein